MTAAATFTISLSGVYPTAVSVDYYTTDGTATAPTNYTTQTGTVHFPANSLTPQTVTVLVTEATTTKTFNLVLRNPVNCVIAAGTGSYTIPTNYLSKFNWIYTKLKNTANGYFGPATGAKQHQMPYHAVETLIAEAPDWGHESVSETMSYWTKLEAWQIALNADTTGYVAMWTSLENNYIPSTTLQPWGSLSTSYTASAPASYMPDEDTVAGYPVAPSTAETAGSDPLYANLLTQYGTKNMYLMHWLWDVDGAFGFHNGDGTTLGVAINNYGRGPHEGLFQTIVHVGWEDWTQGGMADGGYLSLYQQCTPIYSGTGLNPYAKQFSYTAAPDAEVRTIANSYLASQFAASYSLSVATQDTKAQKLGDYLRYCLYDKYFIQVPGDHSGSTVYDHSGAHYLISWYAAFGGDLSGVLAIPPTQGAWGFRIGCSESHFGYNGVDAAYAMATGGGNYSTPGSSTGAAAQWQIAVSRQLEMIRWLQTPQGPIAGGVTNSWLGRYQTPTDGRQNAKFYGLYYTYSPVWHTPPSNQWSGYQAWGLERVASLYLTTASKTDSFSTGVNYSCSVILDKFVPWLLANTTVTATSFTIPTDLGWATTQSGVAGTATSANMDGLYEYLPTLNWDSTGNYSTFWSESSVPNPGLNCSIIGTGIGLGVGASFAQLLLEYAQAKRTIVGGSLTATIPGSTYTVMQAFTLAKGIMDAIWSSHQDTIGFTLSEVRADYSGYGNHTYIPTLFSGTMAHTGDLLNQSTTFISARSFMKSDLNWPQVQAYLTAYASNPTAPATLALAPTFYYHRFWEQVECAAGFAMIQQYFSDLV